MIKAPWEIKAQSPSRTSPSSTRPLPQRPTFSCGVGWTQRGRTSIQKCIVGTPPGRVGTVGTEEVRGRRLMTQAFQDFSVHQRKTRKLIQSLKRFHVFVKLGFEASNGRVT